MTSNSSSPMWPPGSLRLDLVAGVRLYINPRGGRAGTSVTYYSSIQQLGLPALRKAVTSAAEQTAFQLFYHTT